MRYVKVIWGYTGDTIGSYQSTEFKQDSHNGFPYKKPMGLHKRLGLRGHNTESKGQANKPQSDNPVIHHVGEFMTQASPFSRLLW